MRHCDRRWAMIISEGDNPATIDRSSTPSRFSTTYEMPVMEKMTARTRPGPTYSTTRVGRERP